MADLKPRKPLEKHRFRLVTLGDAQLVRVQPGGRASAILGPGKPVALLAYLAHTHGRAASRDQLVELLWADLAPDAARHALRQTVWFIRQRIGADLLQRASDAIHFSGEVTSDRDDFVEAVEQTRFDRAIDIYRGDFLERLTSCGSAAFEQWLDLERYRLQLLLRRTAEVASQQHLTAGQVREARRIARRFKQYAPRDYAASRVSIQVAIAAGDVVAAREEAEALELAARSTSRPLDSESERVVARARAVEAASQGPAKRDETVGRDREFAVGSRAWTRAVDRSVHHVHYAGPPGAGKTRILDDLERFLNASGATVVRIRAYPYTSRIPFSLAGDLVLRVGELPGALGITPVSVSTLLALSPALGGRFHGKRRPHPPRDRLRFRIMATAELFEAVTDEGPLALLIDDLHYGDADSLLLLRGTMERLVDRPVLLVTAGRPSLVTFHIDLHQATEAVTLGPLREADVRQIVQRHANDATSRQHARWSAMSGGYPGPLLELVQSDLGRAQAPIDRATPRLTDSARSALLTCHLNDGCLSWKVANLVTDGHAPECFEPLIQLGLVEATSTGLSVKDGRVAQLAGEAADIHARAAAHRALGRAWMVAGKYDRAALARAGQHFVRAGERDLLVEAYRRWVTLSRRLNPSRPATWRSSTFLRSSPRDPFATYLAARAPAPRPRRRSRAQPAIVGAAGLVVGLATGFTIGQWLPDDNLEQIDPGTSEIPPTDPTVVRPVERWLTVDPDSGAAVPPSLPPPGPEASTATS